jgi:hypothetical protein
MDLHSFLAGFAFMGFLIAFLCVGLIMWIGRE